MDKMDNIYTIDASVLLNAFNEAEEGHAVSHQVISLLVTQAIPIIEPSLVLIEAAATISRTRFDAKLARDFAAALRKLPYITFIPLDDDLTQQALEIAADHRLRGADAVYVAVAQRYGTTLISLDREHLTRVAEIVPTLTPAEMLTTLNHSEKNEVSS